MLAPPCSGRGDRNRTEAEAPICISSAFALFDGGRLVTARDHQPDKPVVSADAAPTPMITPAWLTKHHVARRTTINPEALPRQGRPSAD
jgi:hypothetical protein